MKKYVLFLIIFILWSFTIPAASVNQDKGISKSLDDALQQILQSQGVRDIKSIDCSKVTEKQLEELGDVVMDVMHPDSDDHAFMNRMMGGEGSPSLSTMYRVMGARYLGCYNIAEPYGMMPFGCGGMGHRGDYHEGMMSFPSWGRSQPDDSGSPGCPYQSMHGLWGMMGHYGRIIMCIIFLVVLFLVIFLATKWARSVGSGETPLDILKKKYARGEITKEEFEQKKKDLDL